MAMQALSLPLRSPVPVGKVIIYIFNRSKGSKEVQGAGNLKKEGLHRSGAKRGAER